MIDRTEAHWNSKYHGETMSLREYDQCADILENIWSNEVKVESTTKVMLANHIDLNHIFLIKFEYGGKKGIKRC